MIFKQIQDTVDTDTSLGTVEPIVKDTLQSEIDTVSTKLAKDTIFVTNSIIEKSDQPVKKISITGNTEIRSTKKITSTVDSLHTVSTKGEIQEDINFIRVISKRDSSAYHPRRKVWMTETVAKSDNVPLEPKLRLNKSNENSWVIGISIFILFILIVLRRSYSKFISAIVNTTINFQLAEKMLREKNIITRRAFALLNIIFILSISLFIFLLTKQLEVELAIKTNFSGFLIILLAVSAFVLSKYILAHLFAFIFSSYNIIEEYIHNVYLSNKNIGLFLLPLSISMAFVVPKISIIILYSGVSVIILFQMFRLFRAIQIIIKNRVFLFYSILYLCTFEILPLLFGFKLLKIL